MSISDHKQKELERLSAILQEAHQVQGVSLWTDAWKRLKRNKAAMFSLWSLIVIVLLAIFTPLLPLQSPTYQDVKNRELLPPQMESYSLGIKGYDQETERLQTEAQTHAYGSSEREALLTEVDARVKKHPIQLYWL